MPASFSFFIRQCAVGARNWMIDIMEISPVRFSAARRFTNSVVGGCVLFFPWFRVPYSRLVMTAALCSDILFSLSYYARCGMLLHQMPGYETCTAKVIPCKKEIYGCASLWHTLFSFHFPFRLLGLHYPFISLFRTYWLLFSLPPFFFSPFLLCCLLGCFMTV